MALKSATSLTRSGVSDWIVQRVSAIILAAYSIFFVAYLLTTDMNYETWTALFDCTAMKIATLLALLSYAAHAWIGMWTIGTDYLNERQMGKKGTVLRWIYQAVCAVVVFATLIWAILILWGAA